jgi:hypothetical protein
MPTKCNRLFLLQILLFAQHLIPKTQNLPNLQITFSIFTAPNTTGSNNLYNILELLMMGIKVPQTCWASNKFCNKNHLLHLVGILFPQIMLGFVLCILKSYSLTNKIAYIFTLFQSLWVCIHFWTRNIQIYGPGSVVGIATAYGLDGPGIESWWGRDFPHLSKPDHPASWTMGTGSSSGVRCGRSVTLTPHPLLVPRSKIE